MQKGSKCSPETKITTLKECGRAKITLDPRAPAVNKEDYEGAPGGCYRHEGRWFFNYQATDILDGVSELVCKDTAGTEKGSIFISK